MRNTDAARIAARIAHGFERVTIRFSKSVSAHSASVVHDERFVTASIEVESVP
jgi:hypothetical protein